MDRLYKTRIWMASLQGGGEQHEQWSPPPPPAKVAKDCDDDDADADTDKEPRTKTSNLRGEAKSYMFFFFQPLPPPLSLVGFRDRFNTPTFRLSPPSFVHRYSINQSRHASSSSRYPSRCTTTNQLTNQPNQPCWPYKFIWIPPCAIYQSLCIIHFFFFFAAKLYNWPMRLVTMKMDRFFFSTPHKKKKLLISYYHQSFISFRYAKTFLSFFLKKKNFFASLLSFMNSAGFRFKFL